MKKGGRSSRGKKENNLVGKMPEEYLLEFRKEYEMPIEKTKKGKKVWKGQSFVKDWRLVPGARVSKKRVEKLISYDKDTVKGIEDLTVDDVIAAHSEMYKRTFHSTFAAAEKLWGEKKALELAHEVGYTMGKKGWGFLQEHFGTKDVLPWMDSWYQDIAHLYYGPDTHGYSEYDDIMCVCTRERCLFRPPADKLKEWGKYCVAFDKAYNIGYEEMQPSLHAELSNSFEKPEKLKVPVDVESFPSYEGGTMCQHLWYLKPDEPKVKKVLDEQKKKD